MLKQILAGVAIGAVGIGAGFAGGAVYKDKTIDVTQRDEYKQVVNDNNDLNTKLDATKLALANLTTQRGSLEATKKQLETQLAAAQKQLSDKTAELETKQSELETADEQIRVLNARIATLETDAEANAAQITALQGQVTTLIDTKTSLEADIADLQNEVSGCTLQINNLQDSISSKDSELQALNDKINKLYKGAANYTSVGFDVEKCFNLKSNNYRLDYMQMPNNKIIMTVISTSTSDPLSDDNKGLWEFDPLLDTLEKVDENILQISPIENTNYFVSQSENASKLCFVNENGAIEELGQFSVRASFSGDSYVHQYDDNLVFNVDSGNTYYMICVDKTNNTFMEYRRYIIQRECAPNTLQLVVDNYGTKQYAFYSVTKKKLFHINGSSSLKLFKYGDTLNGLIWAQVNNADSVANTLGYYDFVNETYANITLPIENVKCSDMTLAGVGSDVLISFSENNEIKAIALNLDTKEFKEVTIDNAAIDISDSFAQNLRGAPCINNKYYGINIHYNGTSNVAYSVVYDVDNLVIKCNDFSGSIPTGVEIGTIIRNGKIYRVDFDFTNIPNMAPSVIAWASIKIYELDFEDMSISSVASQSCSSVMGKAWTTLSFEITDDEDTITVLANTGYTYVYDFESLKECGKTQLELKNN
mgnify:FL=1